MSLKSMQKNEIFLLCKIEDFTTLKNFSKSIGLRDFRCVKNRRIFAVAKLKVRKTSFFYTKNHRFLEFCNRKNS
jgi:hypothetical protein